MIHIYIYNHDQNLWLGLKFEPIWTHNYIKSVFGSLLAKLFEYCNITL